MRTRELLKQEWITFRRPGRLIALAAAALVVVALGVLTATGVQAGCDGPCPTDPKAADGSVVGDGFWFVHRDLGRNGSITVRLASMNGTITYPPPNHDQIVSGLVPWAKTGIIVKDGVRQGSAYAALMLTGQHGVRMQYDYRHDIAGMRGSAPRWLRLARAGDTITGYESADGEQWSKVGTATLAGLPETVQVGMFAASPGDLTLRRIALGGAVEEVRFSQATGVFDHIKVSGATSDDWRSESVGEMNHTDWERFHNASGAVWSGGTVKVSGTGDIGPVGNEGGLPVERTLFGLVVALVIVLVIGARFGVGAASRQVLAARAVVVAAAGFVTGLAAAVTIPVSAAILRGKGVPMPAVSALTSTRVVVGVAAVLALSAVLALALGALLRRRWLAVLVAVTLVALPYALGTLPLLPDRVSSWLLSATPAAGFAVQQTLVEYPQVVVHYAASAGYYPLPAWAGLAVLCAYTSAALLMARDRSTTTAGSSSRPEHRQQSRDSAPYSLS